jgi:hypothetical protein
MIEVAYQRFFVAVYHALTSTDSLQARIDATLDELRSLSPEDLPDEQLRARFRDFLAEGESASAVMPSDQAADYLRQALSLFAGIAINYGERTQSAQASALPAHEPSFETLLAFRDEPVS